MNTICLVCCAGYPNFGDEVICRTWLADCIINLNT